MAEWNEKIRVTRMNTGTQVSVTVTLDSTTVNHKTRVLGPTERSIAAAVNECRENCAMLLRGVKEAE